MKLPFKVLNEDQMIDYQGIEYSFYLDARACSGCKACQIACKDKHGLEYGQLWRRVYEISGGEWRQVGDAWVPDVFAYYLSVACNHCAKPICLEICPSKAITKRADGIVLLEEEKCLGCGYCQWACPYGALQYVPSKGRMTKCTFCVDYLDEGKPPACVSACPMRVLNFGDKNVLAQKYSGHDSYPLPPASLTKPGWVISPHKDAEEKHKKPVSLYPEQAVNLKERSLIVFTLLSQLVVGSFIVLGVIYQLVSNRVGLATADLLGNTGLFVIGPLMVLAILFSLFHLGSPSKAYRAILNVKTSWLSREIVFALLFLAGGGVFAGMQWLNFGDFFARNVIAWLAVIFGTGLIYNMSRVYRLRTVPTWDSLGTTIGFFTTSLMLGCLTVGVMILEIYTWMAMMNQVDINFEQGASLALRWVALIMVLLVCFEWWTTHLWAKLVRTSYQAMYGDKQEMNSMGIFAGLRVVLAIAGVGLMGLFLNPNMLTRFPVFVVNTIVILAFILIGLGAVIGRIFFYRFYLRYGL